MSALNDSRFEVRFQCARALDVILQKHPEYRPDPQTVFDIIEREIRSTAESGKAGACWIAGKAPINSFWTMFCATALN